MPSLAPNPQRLARLAGLLYLAIIVLGIGAELAIRAPLIVPGDAAATAANVLAHQGLFRLGLAADAAMALCDVALALLLYALLRPAGPLLAMTATAFRLVQTAVIAANLLNFNAALMLLTRGEALGGLDAAQRETLAMLALENHGIGYDIGLAFFALNCLILGLLLFRSGYFPRLLGPLMGVAGLVYLTGSSLRLLAPGLYEAFSPAYGLCLLAELSLCLWLLIRGVNMARWPAQARVS
ncbi:DUF4386 domain-containing protein [Acidimangrovimonas pyrenivorans]|uniref:DUF4386 domain-containing protein n=1 Tax=Acidimangrovimonas pyrenivorans TaxID=2030798 RepID=A0ABV7AN51_9RHOB